MAETKPPTPEDPPAVDDEKPEERHIVGVGSFVRLDFKKGTVHKTYRPRLPVRALYWLAFQAPFPYASDRDALEACRQRRIVVGLLTKYWFGLDIVAPVLEIEEDAEGNAHFVTKLVEGHEPQNKFRARRFLKLLTNHFIEAGLPTWQVSPHNPRSVGNLMEVADGSYRIIDLESNLVAALTPMSAVGSAIRARQFPNFDDIDTRTLEAYLARHGARLRRVLGQEDYLRLMDAALAYAEYALRWHSREPRIVGRFIGVLFRPFDALAGLIRLFKRLTSSGQVRGEVFVRRSIQHWLRRGWITEEEARGLRRALQDPEVSAALTHLGANMALAIVLFFPFGSLSRFFWPIVQRLRAEARGLVTRRKPRAEREMHTLTVALIGLFPKFLGGGAYLFSKPLRSNRVLAVIAFDAFVRKMPFHLYDRLKLERIMLRLAHKTAAGGPQSVAA